MQGETHTFALTYGCSYEQKFPPRPSNVDQELQDTDCFWTEWSGRSKYQGPYAEAVERSLITLKAMTYRPSGGIAAAPTTSLPERLGGPLNWDYRYCWIRDGTFTVSALLGAGYTEEVISWKAWRSAQRTRRLPDPDHVWHRRGAPYRRLGGSLAYRL